jgi:hypothetical protein
MNTKTYNILLVTYLGYSALLWVVWGGICLVTPEAWSGQVIPGMEVFNLDHATARTEVRAMYGGLQIAIGLLALIAIIKPHHRDTTLLFYVMALTGLALSRAYGIYVEGGEHILVFSLNVTRETYNQIGLACYEFPAAVFAWMLFVARCFSGKDHD